MAKKLTFFGTLSNGIVLTNVSAESFEDAIPLLEKEALAIDIPFGCLYVECFETKETRVI